MPNKVLLINSNREVNPNPVLPVGMAYVASSLAADGFDVSCLDLCFADNWQAQIRKRLHKFVPDFVGISIRNIDNHSQATTKFYLEHIKEMIAFIRGLSPARIFCGGAALAVMPEKILKYLGLEAGIFGDGESATAEFLNKWPKTGVENVPGLVYNKDGKIFANPPVGIADLDALPYPDLPRWLDLGPYFRQETSYPVQAKRGCPFDCIYCTYARGEGKRYRLRAAAAVAAEVVHIQERYWPKTIEFVDSVFNHPEGFAEEICRELISRKSRANLHTIELNPKYLTGELIGLMERAGFSSCGITCESASDKVLGRLKKNYGRDDILAAAQRLQRSKMKRLWIFLLGGPGEDKTTIEETLAFARQELSDNDIVFFNIGIRIYPGTEIETIALNEGLIDKTTDLLYPAFYLSPQVSREYIEERIGAEGRNNIVTIQDISLPYLSKLLKLYSRLGLKVPYWAFAPMFNRLRRLLWLK